jgi:hypothetical protein
VSKPQRPAWSGEASERRFMAWLSVIFLDSTTA